MDGWTLISSDQTTLRTLARAVELHLDTGIEFRFPLAGFLDGFYLDSSWSARKARLRDEPKFKGDGRFDALIGAIGEHLCRRWSLGVPPGWTENPRRFLRELLFLGPERMKPFYLDESPAAYRRRLIFTEFDPLRRARMPKDATWWKGEEIRTGMTPEADEIVTVDIAPDSELKTPGPAG
jgi:hypothetical protein